MGRRDGTSGQTGVSLAHETPSIDRGDRGKEAGEVSFLVKARQGKARHDKNRTSKGQPRAGETTTLLRFRWAVRQVPAVPAVPVERPAMALFRCCFFTLHTPSPLPSIHPVGGALSFFFFFFLSRRQRRFPLLGTVQYFAPIFIFTLIFPISRFAFHPFSSEYGNIPSQHKACSLLVIFSDRSDQSSFLVYLVLIWVPCCAAHLACTVPRFQGWVGFSYKGPH